MGENLLSAGRGLGYGRGTEARADEAGGTEGRTSGKGRGTEDEGER